MQLMNAYLGNVRLRKRASGSLQRDTGLPSLFPGENRSRREFSILGQHTSVEMSAS